MFLKNKNIIFKIRRSKVTDYAALKEQFLKVEKLTFTALGDHLECYYFIIHVLYCVANGS